MTHDATRQARFEQALTNLEMAIKSGDIRDPWIRDCWERSLIQGHTGDKARAMLDQILPGPSILADLVRPAEPPEPDSAGRHKLILGRRTSSGVPTGIALDTLKMHLLIQGPSGAGKTTVIWSLIDQLVRYDIRLVFFCSKDEGRKLLRRYPNVIVLRISDFRENFFKPVGDANHYYASFWSEFGESYRIHRETVSKVIAISHRIYEGLPPNTPHPSLKDMANVLHRMSKSERDGSLGTVAGALDSANATLGLTASVREGPCAEDLFPIVVVATHGLPPEFLQFFMGVWMLRTHVKAIRRENNE